MPAVGERERERERERACGSNSHAPGITRIQHLFRQLQEGLSNKCPTGVEDCRRALDVVSVFVLHLLHHAFDALRVRDIRRDPDRFTAGVVDGVDDGDVGVWVAGEESDGVGGGEFAGDGCAGLRSFFPMSVSIWGRRRSGGTRSGGNLRLGRRRR